MLDDEAEQMGVWLHATTTLTAPNYDVAVVNHGKAAEGYRRRVPFVLARVREALDDIGRC